MKENEYSQAILHQRQKMNILKKHRKHYQYMQVGLGPAIIKSQASESEYDLKKLLGQDCPKNPGLVGQESNKQDCLTEKKLPPRKTRSIIQFSNKEY